MSGQWQRKRVGQDWAPLGVEGPTLAGSGIQVTQDDNGAEVRYVDRSGVAARYFAAGQPLVIDSAPPPPINPPAISSHPSSVTTDVGTQVTLTSVATGQDVTWVWSSSANGIDWTAINGATGSGTTATLSFTASLDDSGVQYRVVFTNPGGAVTSNAATVTVQSVSGADYVVTSAAEWDTTMALGGATLSGKIVELQGSITDVSLENLTCSPPLTIRGAAGSTIRRMDLSGISGLRFVNVYHQMTGWPAVYTEMTRLRGAITDVRWLNCTWRHGYGPNQEEWRLDEHYPEYNRINNVVTATTTNTTVELQYQDTFANIPRNAWIEFFNRGSVPVHYAIGGSDVVATTSNPVAPANARTRISWPVSTTDRPSHIAVITASGASEVNARTEIGIAVYMANAVDTGSPTAQLNGVWWQGCDFKEVISPLKAPGNPAGIVVVDRCKLGPYYLDAIAFSGLTDTPGHEVWVTRNDCLQPGEQSGIAEDLFGHARDPHGDAVLQLYQPSQAAIPMARVRVAGNRYLPASLRPNMTAQAVFLSPPTNGSIHLDDVIVVSNVLPFGNQNAISLGRDNNECLVRNAIVEANTILGRDNLERGRISCRQDTSGNYHTLIKNNIARSIQTGTDLVGEGSVLWDANNLGAVFATPEARLATTGTSAEYAAGITPIPALADRGYQDSLIDWNTDNPFEAIRWDLLDPGVRWRNEIGVEKSTLITSEWRRAIGGPSTMTIAATAGCEYRIADNSSGAGASAWTSSSGTFNRGQWLQVRGTSSSDDLTLFPIGVVLNGQTISFTSKTVGPFFTSGGDFGFKDPAGTSSLSGTGGRLVVEATLRADSIPNAFFVYSHAVHVTTLDVGTGGNIRQSIRDSAGTQVLGSTSIAAPNGSFVVGQINNILASIDLPGRMYRMWNNGDLLLEQELLENTGQFAGTGVMNMLQSNSGGSRYSGRVYGLKIWKGLTVDDGNAPSATPYFAIPGIASTANDSPWKNGSGVAT
jgi:hypothetical protein